MNTLDTKLATVFAVLDRASMGGRPVGRDEFELKMTFQRWGKQTEHLRYDVELKETTDNHTIVSAAGDTPEGAIDVLLGRLEESLKYWNYDVGLSPVDEARKRAQMAAEAAASEERALMAAQQRLEAARARHHAAEAEAEVALAEAKKAWAEFARAEAKKLASNVSRET
jgi:hypothetical protein